MKICKICIAVACSVLLLSSFGCRKRSVSQPVEVSEVKFGVIAAKVSAATAPKLATEPNSRTVSDANNDFTLESQLGIYATEYPVNDVSLSPEASRNVGYFNPTGSTNWSSIEAGKALYYLKDNLAMNFFAYHPYTGQLKSSVKLSTSAVSPTLVYTLISDQSTLSDLTNADLMWGTSSNVKQSDGMVKLAFSHALSKLSFSILKGADWMDEELYISRISVKGNFLSDGASLNISTGALTVSEAANAQVFCNYSPAIAVGASNARICQFIVVPSNSTDLTVMLTAKGSYSDQKTYTATLPAVQLKQATMRNINIVIYKSSQMFPQIAPTIKAWEFVTDIAVDGI